MTCDNCQNDSYKLRCEKGVWLCVVCRNRTVSYNHGLSKKVLVGKTWATEAQLKELERRVILPYNKPDGGYYVGRRMENGKVAEKHPDYKS